MKKIFAFNLLIALVVLTACEKHEEIVTEAIVNGNEYIEIKTWGDGLFRGFNPNELFIQKRYHYAELDNWLYPKNNKLQSSYSLRFYISTPDGTIQEGRRYKMIHDSTLEVNSWDWNTINFFTQTGREYNTDGNGCAMLYRYGASSSSIILSLRGEFMVEHIQGKECDGYYSLQTDSSAVDSCVIFGKFKVVLSYE